jgi:hypothetical protein
MQTHNAVTLIAHTSAISGCQPQLDASLDAFQTVACVIILGVIAIYAIVAVLERYKDKCCYT